MTTLLKGTVIPVHRHDTGEHLGNLTLARDVDLGDRLWFRKPMFTEEDPLPPGITVRDSVYALRQAWLAAGGKD